VSEAAIEAAQDPLSVAESFGEAWAAHDLETALSYLDPQCVFDATGPAPDGTRYVGVDEIRSAWKAIFGDPGARFDAEETFGAGEDRVIQRWRYSWDGGHVRGVDLMKVRAGKIVEKFSYVKG
jgi:ketosteroid isomerase-like protein